MKTRRTSRFASIARPRTRFDYLLASALLPIALQGCSSSDASPAAPEPTATPAETPDAPAGDTTPVESGTPAASPGDVQPITDLVMPGENGEDAVAAPGSDNPLAEEPGAEGETPSGCVGQAWPTADPTSAGPFAVTVDRNVGPLAGFLPDPVYGDDQQRFNIYRPSNLDSSGFCHPILVWANGRGDNPEQNPPRCFVDPATNTWCGTYPGLMNQLASHGFVVIASLSTTTSRGEPLPTITGLDWLLEQAEDPESPYFHRLDTTRIGALGHSEGGASTSMAAADPRIDSIATICGSRALTGLHGPALFTCGGLDTVVSCDSVANTFNSVTDQPAMFMNNLAADHGSWLGQNGPQGPTFFALTAWFRVHLMDDAANRSFFYGPDCALCTDSRVAVQRNDLMAQ